MVFGDSCPTEEELSDQEDKTLDYMAFSTEGRRAEQC